jgi:uncharacterized protein YjiS (DUF1127 family)
MSTFQLKPSSANTAAARSDLGGAHLRRLFWSSMRVVHRATGCVLVWRQRARERRALENLSDHMLRDIGLTRADVMAEATKPFWQR